MKKYFIIVILCLGAIGFYYYQYVDEVTDRYLVKYSLPHQNEGVYGSYMTKPKIEVINLPQYKSDSDAVKKETIEAESFKEGLLEKFENEDFKDDNEIINTARRNAYMSLLDENRMIISITHVRSIDAKEALEIIKEHGLFSDDVKEYAEKHKLKAIFYPL